ncbi:MAG TPA: hypothetical protein DCE44_00085, partial [Verrucomicrobiales bacterium]|nr:hypothetical protein [Verrucomicrobiales bacterium]
RHCERPARSCARAGDGAARHPYGLNRSWRDTGECREALALATGYKSIAVGNKERPLVAPLAPR